MSDVHVVVPHAKRPKREKEKRRECGAGGGGGARARTHEVCDNVNEKDAVSPSTCVDICYRYTRRVHT